MQARQVKYEMKNTNTIKTYKQRFMKKFKLTIAALCLLLFSPAAKADEGMWLLQLMKEQNSIDMMKKAGLKLEADDLYNPNGVSLKDAVGIFGGGCTGEIISGQGLILTNHHCGYDAIQQHSSVEHDYLTDGFWAGSFAEELPTPGLKFKFVTKIDDVTELINKKIAAKEVTETEALSGKFLSELEEELYKNSDLYNKPGIEPELLPFYAGNRYYMIYKKVYPDVRMVAAPPSSIGKFGGETDNWMWPRHTCDFSVFRIYADANGEPAEYSENNVPLKTDKHFTISLRGIEEGDYAMVMGFPGSTQRYLTRSEVQMTMDNENTPRITVRDARLNVLRDEMAKSDKVRIQYASKFAQSSNYWKNAIGMNKAIIDNKVLDAKTAQEKLFAKFANEKNDQAYKTVVSEIDALTKEMADNLYKYTYTIETFYAGIEFGTPYSLLDSIVAATENKNTEKADKFKELARATYSDIFNKDYDHEVDRKVAKALIPLYAEKIAKEDLPEFYSVIEKKFKGEYDKYIDELYDNSIYSNEKNLEKFLKKPTRKALDKDLGYGYAKSKWDKIREMMLTMSELDKKFAIPHKTYIRGIGEMRLAYEGLPSYPDANFTLRLTYGNVKSYDPKDGIHYKYMTTLDGVMEKEDPNNPEFVVPAKLKELYENKDFGRYAMKDGRMPACFISTNDITGGNSGSPVINAEGQLIGSAFDGNWESLSGDINFDNELQRCICVDIRYVLFIIEKLGGCTRLIDEMTIVE